MGQYAYRALSKFNKVFRLEHGIELREDTDGEGELYFVYDVPRNGIISENSRLLKRKVIFCHQESLDERPEALKIIVNKSLAQGYLRYQMNSYHLSFYHNSDMRRFLSIFGYNFYNINFILKLMFFNNLTFEVFENYSEITIDSSFTVSEEEIEQLSLVLQLNPGKIDRGLMNEFLEKESIQEFMEKKYFFYNGTFFIVNAELYLKYRSYENRGREVLNRICRFIEKNPQKNDSSLLDHMIWIVSKFKSLDSCEQQIRKIEKYLFDKFRFTAGSKMLEFIELCLKLLEKGSDTYIIFQVNSANIYMDFEEYKTAETILDNVLEMSRGNRKIYYYVLDERVRLFERIERNAEALKGLYQVKDYYISENESAEKIRNVSNRIGENLYFTGEVKKAKECLEDLFYVDLGGKINVNNILSCEIANNLSLCYLEEGSYDRAIGLMDTLYKTYLQTDNCPANYATDILQNKGSVYLNTKEYHEAVKYFELALKDEKNPYSKQLILENYMYAKAMADNNFMEAVSFFEEQCRTTISDETKRMLAEVYYGAGYFEQCIEISDNLIAEMKKKKNLYVFLASIVLRAKSRVICGKMGMIERIITLIQLEWYKVLAKKKIGEKSFYYNELRDGISFLIRGQNR